MKNIFVVIIILLSGVPGLDAQYHREVSSVNDGPYIFRREKRIIANWIENGYIRQKPLNPESFQEVKAKFGLQFGFRDVSSTFNLRHEFRFAYRGVDSLAIISDIHGEYFKYLALLKGQGIIDSSNRWNFGKGHLVILGDCFDRGDKVTELLWHIFGLEKQAEKAGGMVHYILGNHEVMILGDDLRYLNDKYRRVEEITGMKYQELYSSESLLGKWLRHKPIVISINNLLLVHGGISTEVIRKKLHVEEINHLFYQMQVLREVESDHDLDNLMFLNEDKGPIWYRGYFEDPAFSELSADSVLNYFGKDHIIVGHTISNGFQSMFGNKILGIDAGISNNLPGAMLIIKNGILLQGTPDGIRKPL